MSNEIPPITDPLGRAWDQPSVADMLLDDKHALMTSKTFESLHEYSYSIPTGVYEGKMWKSCPGKFYRNCPDGVWYLLWFGHSNDPNYVSNNQREIIVVD